MRFLGLLVLAAIMYFGVPYLWQRAMVREVQKVAGQPSPVPTVAAIPGNPDLSDLAVDMNAINPKVEIDTKKYEQIAVQSAVDQQMRQVQQAQDMAYRAQHPGGY